MQLTSSSFIDQGMIPGEFAFAVTATENHIQLSSNNIVKYISNSLA